VLLLLKIQNPSILTSKFYTYRVTFPGFPWFYYGVHRDNGKSYFGSPVTHKWIWDFYECEVQILEWFNSWEEALAVEQRLIRPFLDDSNCLNEHCGGNLSSTACKKGHDTQKQRGIGIHSPSFPNPATPESCSTGGKIGGKLPWWNNGHQNTRSLECPGEGWVQGRLVVWKWFNDGHKNVRSNDCPEGYVQGRIMPRNEAGKFKV
jgi:hypothetical protein